MYARVHTLSTISTQESSQADNGPIEISKSIYSLNSRARVVFVLTICLTLQEDQLGLSLLTVEQLENEDMQKKFEQKVQHLT